MIEPQSKPDRKPVDHWGESLPIVDSIGLLPPMNVDPGLVLVHYSCVDAALSFESPNG
jgi:hypothetical protein